MINYDEPYWCEEDHPPVLCYDYCPACAEAADEYFNWEEKDYGDNKLFYENDLSHLEELPSKEKM